MIEVIPNSVDRQIKETLSNELANQLDRIDVDWESDDTMMGYYLDSMRRIWMSEVKDH